MGNRSNVICVLMKYTQSSFVVFLNVLGGLNIYQGLTMNCFCQLLEEGFKPAEVKETLARAYLKLEQHLEAEKVSEIRFILFEQYATTNRNSLDMILFLKKIMCCFYLLIHFAGY